MFVKNELLQKVYRSLKAINNISLDLAYYNYYKLYRVSRSSSLAKIRNRCIVSNRSRSVYRALGLSRIKFRDLASQGLLFGIRKASW